MSEEKLLVTVVLEEVEQYLLREDICSHLLSQVTGTWDCLSTSFVLVDKKLLLGKAPVVSTMLNKVVAMAAPANLSHSVKDHCSV